VSERYEQLGRALAFVLTVVVGNNWIQGGPAALNPFLDGTPSSVTVALLSMRVAIPMTGRPF